MNKRRARVNPRGVEARVELGPVAAEFPRGSRVRLHGEQSFVRPLSLGNPPTTISLGVVSLYDLERRETGHTSTRPEQHHKLRVPELRVPKGIARAAAR